MMSEQKHLSDQQAEDFRKLRMSADEKRSWELHMACCHHCLDRVYGGTNSDLAVNRLTEAFLSPGEEDFHLSLSESERYGTGFLDEADKTIFESHLEGCPECRSEVAGQAISRPRDLALATEPSFWHGVARFWHVSGFSVPVRLAMVCVLVGCLVVSWGLWHRRNSRLSPSEPRAGADISVVRLRDGNTQITLDKEGNVTGLEGLDPSAEIAVRAALATARLSPPRVLSDLSGPAIKLLGETGHPSTFSLIAPVNIVVAEEQPVLRWQALAGATHYTVAVFDSQFRRVANSEPQPGTEWSVPWPLRRGATYFWQVTAKKGKEQITVPAAPASRAAFKVLDSRAAEDLEKVRVIAPGSHLRLGILYARAGLQMDAERELEMSVTENPQSPIPAKLLSDVRSWGH